jgi:hypothetical protein
MKTYHHILLVTDFLQGSDALGYQAVVLAEEHGARLSILTIYQPESCEFPLRLSTADKLKIHTRQQQLNQLGQRLVVPQFDLRFAVGNPAQLLPGIACQMLADAVIVGRHTPWLVQLQASSNDVGYKVLPMDINLDKTKQGSEH